MDMQNKNAVTVLQEAVSDGSMSEAAASSAVFLSERLEQLKRSSRMFEAVSFSPEVEAMLAEHLAAAAN
jgi:hypothetical protein